MPVSHSFHRRLLLLTSGAFVLLFIYYFGTVYRHRLGVVPKHGGTVHEEPEEIEEICMGNDPIKALLDKADNAWRKYDSARSLTFRDAVVEYRVRYGRHPPPGFKEVSLALYNYAFHCLCTLSLVSFVLSYVMFSRLLLSCS